MEKNKTCFGKFDKDNCECIICNVVVECYESKLVQMIEHHNIKRGRIVND